MTPKEKAKELYFKMMEHSFGGDSEQSKQCALIAVDEILYSISGLDDSVWYRATKEFLELVKQEIEKL